MIKKVLGSNRLEFCTQVTAAVSLERLYHLPPRAVVRTEGHSIYEPSTLLSWYLGWSPLPSFAPRLRKCCYYRDRHTLGSAVKWSQNPLPSSQHWIYAISTIRLKRWQHVPVSEIPADGTEGIVLLVSVGHNLEPPKTRVFIRSYLDQFGLWMCLAGSVLIVDGTTPIAGVLNSIRRKKAWWEQAKRLHTFVFLCS